MFIAKIELIRPDSVPNRPPPAPKEKPPEPEPEKQQHIVTPPRDMPQDVSSRQAPGPKGDDKPAAQGPLGLRGKALPEPTASDWWAEERAAETRSP